MMGKHNDKINQKYTINKLTPHKFFECSDLPQLCHLGIFSCSACDEWRERMHRRGFGKSLPQKRDFLNDMHQCHRKKLGIDPSRIRVIRNAGGNEGSTSDHSNVMENKENKG
jgi:hypothetical protein